jgi:hypothetical protein
LCHCDCWVGALWPGVIPGHYVRIEREVDTRSVRLGYKIPLGIEKRPCDEDEDEAEQANCQVLSSVQGKLLQG